MAVIERRFDRIIGLVLRYGVTISFAIVAFGSILLFVESQTGYGALGTAEQLSNARFLLGPGALFQGVFAGRPFAIIELGLVVLFATPVARVFVSIFLFVEEKRYIFVGITILVLAILLLSTFVIGPILANS